MQLDIISPDESIFSGEVDYVQLPGTEGLFGILNNHAPLISTLSAGKINIKDNNNKEQSFTIDGGLVKVLKNKVIVLVETT